MGCRRLVVHVGAQKTASSALQRALFRNRAVLAAHGVHLPTTGRVEFAADAVNHHHLAWQIHQPRKFSERQGGWEALAAELVDVEADTVLLSCEEFLITMLSHRESLEQRLRALAEDITIVIFVREQLSLINSLYAQYVKMLRELPPFPDFVADHLTGGASDFDALFAPWYDAPHITLRAIPFGGVVTASPLTALLDAAAIECPPDLDLRVPRANPSLGPIGVEAAHLLSRHIRGRFPTFDAESHDGRSLHRVAGRRALENGWCRDTFWGWTPDLARDAAQRLSVANDRFARTVWGHDWPLAHPVDQPPRTARFEDLPPGQADRVSRYVLALTDRYSQMRGDPAGHRPAPPDGA